MTNSQLEVTTSIEKFVREFIFEDLVEDDPDLLEEIATADDIKNSMLVIEDLDGDSLMMISLLKDITKEFGVEADLDELGRKLISRPAETVGEIIDMSKDLVTKGPDAFN